MGEWEAGDGDATNGGVWAFAVEDVLFARCDGDVKSGANLLAVEVIRYGSSAAQAPDISQTPMNALVYVEKSDGSVEIFKTGDAGWKGGLNVSGTWQQAGFDDSSWRDAIGYVEKSRRILRSRECRGRGQRGR